MIDTDVSLLRGCLLVYGHRLPQQLWRCQGQGEGNGRHRCGENQHRKNLWLSVYMQTKHQPTLYGSHMCGVGNVAGKPNNPLLAMDLNKTSPNFQQLIVSFMGSKQVLIQLMHLWTFSLNDLNHWILINNTSVPKKTILNLIKVELS